MNRLRSKGGFTLLEIIIVIIIVGVLASLALPRFFKTVEYARATEALSELSALRQSVQRCYMSAGTYATCNAIATLDVEDPNSAPNAHFSYTIAAAATGFTLQASRNGTDNSFGSMGNFISLNVVGVKGGNGAFSGVR